MELKQVEQSKFWYLQTKGKATEIKISHHELLMFVQQHVGVYQANVYGRNCYVRNSNNILEEISRADIGRLLLKYIKEEFPLALPDGISRKDLICTIVKGAQTYLNEHKTNMLELLPIEFVRDTKGTAFFPYSNGIVKVTSKTIELEPYGLQAKCLWKKEIIQRSCAISAVAGVSEMEQLVTTICKEDAKRIQSLMSIIGYLLHTYKDPSVTYMIIFMDEQVGDDDSANGGTGKSLLATSLKYMRHLQFLEGKRVDMKGRFVFQTYEPGVRILVLDDVPMTFNIEPLYSLTTTCGMIEAKFQKQLLIPYEDLWKTVVLTNYVITGSGGNSEDRRRIDFEFSDAYGPTSSPRKQFGHNLFTDWDVTEWQKFDLFMLKCVQLFLQQGIIEPPVINKEFKKVLRETNPAFYDFFEVYLTKIRRGGSTVLINKKVAYRLFIKENNDFRDMRQNTFTKWVRRYCKFKGYPIAEEPANTKENYRIDVSSDAAVVSSAATETPVVAANVLEGIDKVTEDSNGRLRY